MFEWQPATHQRCSPVAKQFEGPIKGANSLAHAGQSSPECALGRKTDPIVRNLDGDFFASDGRADIYPRGPCMPKHVGHAFLDDAIGRLREQAVDIVQARVDAGGEPDVRALRLCVAKQDLDALLESKLLHIERLKPSKIRRLVACNASAACRMPCAASRARERLQIPTGRSH